MFRNRTGVHENSSTVAINFLSGCIGSALSLLTVARPRDTNVSLSADEFWKAVDGWKLNEIPITVELVRVASPQPQDRFTGIVLRVARPLVIFYEAKTNKEHPIDFADAEIFIGGFEIVEPFGMVRVFEVSWKKAELATCRLMEPRETTIAN